MIIPSIAGDKNLRQDHHTPTAKKNRLALLASWREVLVRLASIRKEENRGNNNT
jgi:hypothetical protein